MNKSERIINQLFSLARDHEAVANAKIVAALAYKGTIISYGFNQARTSWMARRFRRNPKSHYLHAEVDAVRNALKIVDAFTISKSTLYVARAKHQSRNGPMIYGMAKPCIGCQECIEFFNIKKVFYSLDGEGIEELK